MRFTPEVQEWLKAWAWESENGFDPSFAPLSGSATLGELFYLTSFGFLTYKMNEK